MIDIGSNSLRLVVYAGPERLPWPILNEKVPAALGRTLSEDGMIPAKAMDLAIAGLGRFVCLLGAMKLPPTRVVATAAARDAKNGAEFLDRVRALGLKPELLSGEQEAAGSAMGILSAFPDADGVVGDLGGGSLELVEVADQAVGRGESFPLGTLRLPRLRAVGGDRFERLLKTQLDASGWSGAAAGRTFHCVGGSWRALAHVDMAETGCPLFDPHGYALRPQRLTELARIIEEMPAKRLRDIPGVSANRAASLADATALLAALTRTLEAGRIVFSSFGLREGLLYGMLDPATRRLDPLAVAVRDYVGHQGGDAGAGEALAEWTAGAFAGDAADARLRHAACLLATIGVPSERALRARRGVATALHERWVGIDPRGRAMLARALHGATGQKDESPELARLAPAADLARAAGWGLALRLAARLCGSVPAVLARSQLATEAGRLTLRLPAELGQLYGEGAESSHRALAAHLGLEPVLAVEGPRARRWLGR